MKCDVHLLKSLVLVVIVYISIVSAVQRTVTDDSERLNSGDNLQQREPLDIKECSSFLDFACLRTNFVKGVLSISSGKSVKLFDGFVEIEKLHEQDIETKKNKKGKLYKKEDLKLSKESSGRAIVEESFGSGILNFLKNYALNLNVLPGYMLHLTRGSKDNSIFNMEIRENSNGEGRGKMKRLYPLLMLMIFKAALIPVAMLIIKALAFKALVVNKIAFVIAALSGLKTMMKLGTQNQGYGSSDLSGYYYGGGGGGGGGAGGDWGHESYVGSESNQGSNSADYSSLGTAIHQHVSGQQQQASTPYSGASSSQVASAYVPQNTGSSLTAATIPQTVGYTNTISNPSITAAQTVVQQAVPYSQTVVGQLSSPYVKSFQNSPYITQAVAQQQTSASTQTQTTAAVQQPITTYTQAASNTQGVYAPASPQQYITYTQQTLPQQAQQQAQPYALNTLTVAQKKSTDYASPTLKRRKTS